MKNLITIILTTFIVFSCNNKEEYEKKIATEKQQKIDSINMFRKRHNDKILAKRGENRHTNLEGKHAFTMSSDGISTLKGSVNFTKISGDEYKISGNASSGKNTISIEGTGKLLNSEFLNFSGDITQNIPVNGGIYKRKGEKTFQAKGKNKFWRLQDMVNGAGFVDYIDIHF